MVVGGAYLLLVVLSRLAGEAVPHGGGRAVIWVMLGLLLATMLIGIPILLCIALVSFIGIAAEPGMVMPLFAQKSSPRSIRTRCSRCLTSSSPGALMTAGGMSQQLVDFARVLVGHFRAGLAHASVVASMVFVGRFGLVDRGRVRDLLGRDPDHEEDGLQAGLRRGAHRRAGTIGAIIPPSMTMVVYGAIAQVSIGGLFLGGIIPGILVGLVLMAMVKPYTYHPNYPELRVHGRFDLFATPCSLKRRMAGAARRRSSSSAASCRGVHRHRGRRGRLPVRVRRRHFYLPQDQAARSRQIFVESGDHHHHGVGVIAVSGAMGWLLSYMQFNDMAISGSVPRRTRTSCCGLAAVMIVLGTFVDSLAILLVFAPVAVELASATASTRSRWAWSW